MSMQSQGSREAASEGPTVLHIRVATRAISPDMTTVFHAWAYGRFIEIQSNLRRKKLHRMN